MTRRYRRQHVRKKNRSRYEFDFGDGWRSGYAEYRDGSKPTPAVKLIYKGQKRDHVVSVVMDRLRDWRFSPFEREAECVHELRRMLVLAGYTWHRSNNEALVIVAAGLHLLGAKRPDWAEGQLNYLIPRENCKWCRGPMDDEDIAAGRGYCSDHCFQCTRAVRAEFSETPWRVMVHQPKYCLHCDREFAPADRRSVFCSISCKQKAMKVAKALAAPEQPCFYCGTAFKPSSPIARYCSFECKYAVQKVVTKLRRGPKKPPPLSPIMFDVALELMAA